MTREPVALDTNVLSEIMNPAPAEQVVKFVAELQDPFVSAAVFHEMAYGAHRLPEGKRKARFFAEIEAFQRIYEQRILTITYEVARKSGALRAQAQSLGYDLKPMDSMIAASAVVAGARLATRNLKDFQPLGIDLVNPWTYLT
jgi:predicted nucleic acid-binding protein